MPSKAAILAVVCLIVGLVAGLGAGALMVKPVTTTVTETMTKYETRESTRTETVTITMTVTATATPPATVPACMIGDECEGKGIVIIVHSMERTSGPLGTFMPREGYDFLILDITFKNRLGTEYSYSQAFMYVIDETGIGYPASVAVVGLTGYLPGGRNANARSKRAGIRMLRSPQNIPELCLPLRRSNTSDNHNTATKKVKFRQNTLLFFMF